MTNSQLTTHVLNTAQGCPAHGMKIELWRLTGKRRRCVVVTRTNADGRTGKPLLAGKTLRAGRYEIIFHVGDYFRAKLKELPELPFLDEVPVRFGISDARTNWHVPLLCSLWEIGRAHV